jgi:undecaprenyl-diphosphatase
MSLLQIIVLALVQGITEYLPVSSEGHNILVPILSGWPDQGTLADAVINLGTLAATTVYFWRDVLAMFRGLGDAVRRERTRDARLMVNVVIATIPILVVGYVLEATHIIDHLRNSLLIAANAIVFGVLLYVFDAYGMMRRTIADMNWQTSLIIGCAQALALNPGTSRSGITMTAARGLGFVRSEAARFSFLISIPANAAASVFVLGKAFVRHEHVSGPVILTTVVTFFVALMTIHLLMQMVRHMSFLPFTIYRLLLGGALIYLIYSGVVPLTAVN